MKKYRVDAQLLFDGTDIEGGITITFPADHISEATKMAEELFTDTLSDCKADVFAVTEVTDDTEEEGE